MTYNYKGLFVPLTITVLFSYIFVPTLGDDVQACDGSPLLEVEDGDWICGSDTIVYGTMCELDCTDPYSIPEGDYLVTCTPEGWFPDPAQVFTLDLQYILFRKI